MQQRSTFQPLFAAMATIAAFHTSAPALFAGSNAKFVSVASFVETEEKGLAYDRAKLLGDRAAKTLEEAEAWLAISRSPRQFRVLGICASIARSGDKDLSPKAVGVLVHYIRTRAQDAHADIRAACRCLMDLPESLVTAKVRKSIRDIDKKPASEPYFLLLLGVVGDGDKDVLAYLREVAEKNRKQRASDPASMGWAARLALARQGDEGMIRSCIEEIQQEKDARFRMLYLVPYLGYIRQPPAVTALVRYLNSDDAVPSSPPDIKSIPYASCAAAVLATCVENMPHPHTSPAGFSLDEIKEARAWVKKNRIGTSSVSPQKGPR